MIDQDDLESASEAVLQWRDDLTDLLLGIERAIASRSLDVEPALHPALDRLARAAVTAMEGAADDLVREREVDLRMRTPDEPTIAPWPFAITVLPGPHPADERGPEGASDLIEATPDVEDEKGCGCAGGARIVVPPAIVVPTPKQLRTIVVSPSKLGLPLFECERCFVRDVRDRIARPGMVAEFYNVADEATKLAFDQAMRTEGVVDLGAPDVPRFRVIAHNLNVRSTPIPFDDLGVALQIKGRLDALVETDDGRRVILDYKTSKRDVDLAKYHGQLGSYALACAWPTDGVDPIEADATALLVLKPDAVAIRAPKLAISGSLAWIDVERDDAKAVALLRRAAALVTGAIAPVPDVKCAWCTYYGAVPLVAGNGAR